MSLCIYIICTTHNRITYLLENLLERKIAQREHARTNEMLQTKYIIFCDTEYRDRLLATSLLPLSYWHEYLDVVFFYKANHDIFNIDKKILPFPQPQGQRQTRSFNPNSHKYKIPTYKTSTYAKSYKIRTSRIWNVHTTQLYYIQRPNIFRIQESSFKVLYFSIRKYIRC